VVRFARLMQRRGRVLGGPSARAASGGNLSLPWLPRRVVRQDRGRLDMFAAVLGRLSPPGHKEPAAGARRWRWIASNAS
jgi:hypothetical protein